MTAPLPAAAEAMVRHARVARVATLLPDGSPHVVPVCPVLDEGRIVFASDDNRKLRNLRDDPRVAVVFDDYLEDWDALRRVLVFGRARVIGEGAEWERGRTLLYAKFEQYEPHDEIVPGRTSLVQVEIERVAAEGV